MEALFDSITQSSTHSGGKCHNNNPFYGQSIVNAPWTFLNDSEYQSYNDQGDQVRSKDSF